MIWVNLAWRNVLANRRRSLMAIAAVVAATIALVIFANYINAIRTGLQYSTIHGGTGHLQLSGKGGFDAYTEEPLQYALTRGQYQALQSASDHLPAIRRLVPRLAFSGLVSSGPRTLSFAGQGIDPEAERTAFGARQVMAQGRALTVDSPSNAIVLGTELARRLGVKPGDTVTVLTPTVSGALNASDFVVQGLENTGSPQSDLFHVRALLPAVQDLLVSDKISTVAILLDEDADIAVARRQIEAAVAGSETRDWLQLTPIYSQVVRMYEDQFHVFGAFILIITLFGLATLTLTSVLERTREIGTLRALGIGKGTVRQIFLYEGLIIAGIGLACGTLLAALLGQVATAAHLTMPPPPGRTTGFPLRLLWDWRATGLDWVWIIALGAVTAWVASGRIARLRVVDALTTL